MEGDVSPVLLHSVVGGLTNDRLAKGKALTPTLTRECREKCASRRKNWGLNKEEGWGQRALTGKQMTFRKDNGALGEQVEEMVVSWQCLFRVEPQGRGFMTVEFFWQIKGLQENERLLPAFAHSQMPSAQNNSFATVVYSAPPFFPSKTSRLYSFGADYKLSL